MENNSVTCAFTGHRPKSLPWGYNENRPDCVNFKKVLESEIRKLIAQGVMSYISGCALGVDAMAAEIVLQLKNEFALSLECAIPHEELSRILDKASYHKNQIIRKPNEKHEHSVA